MAIDAVLVSEDTCERLGDGGVGEVMDCLWAVDCQSCGKLLGDDPPALCVDDLIVSATASLHHAGCRVPEWNDSAVMYVAAGNYTSFVTRMVLLPVDAGRGEETLPMMVVNPSLECVPLTRDGGGGWRVAPERVFAGAGLERAGLELPAGMPVAAAVARVMESSVAVAFQAPPYSVYEAAAGEEMVACARARGGLLIGVTHDLNPGTFSSEDLMEAMAGGRMVAGWAGMHGSPRPARRRGRRRRPELWALHWNSRHMTVGTLAGIAPRRFSEDRARSWAARVIDPGAALAWELVDKECPEDGWRVMQPFSARHFFLRRQEDGWYLVLSCSHVAGGRAETDNEAKAWAAGVASARAGVDRISWAPGPSTPGSASFYGRAR